MEDIKEKVVSHMVNRFLGWRLPEDFNPDGGITFTPANGMSREEAIEKNWWPVGTNLFTAQQAEEMIRFMVDGYMDVRNVPDRPINHERP